MTEEVDESGHARNGALEALAEAAKATDRKKYGIAMDSFEQEDYDDLIGLAWRFQFDDDRSKFKRELRKLQEHVSARVLARLELKE